MQRGLSGRGQSGGICFLRLRLSARWHPICGTATLRRAACGDEPFRLDYKRWTKRLVRGDRLARNDRVAAGDVLGRCGNSGNSSEAHLHFQVSNALDPYTAVSIPIRFQSHAAIVQGMFVRG
ncbi:M23 family metallopeptidase [Brevibacillus agri]|uniref:M23 family metallopeptidase n=1 Tax=Brevibacillus agri TaxID=51101 RepID=UPI00399D0CD6